MTRKPHFIVLISAASMILIAMLATANAAEESCPSCPPKSGLTQVAAAEPQALPDGHPPTASDKGQLPSGHPPVAGGKGKLPSGHPTVKGGNSRLPAGHPPAGQKKKIPQGPFTGSLAIKAVQGTKDGPKAGGDEVLVQFYTRTGQLEEVRTKLDEHGVIVLNDRNFPNAVQPLVTVTHAGAEYATVGRVMSSEATDQMVRVPVYEVTDKKPDLKIGMRHVLIRSAPSGLQIEEVIALTNPTDRAWLGDASAEQEPKDSKGKQSAKTTFLLPLPANATQVKLGRGFASNYSSVAPGRITHTKPLLPGKNEFQLSYVIPATDGQVAFELTAPAPVAHMMILAPDDGSVVAVNGAALQKPDKSKRQIFRNHMAKDLAEKQTTKIQVSGLAAQKPTQSAVPAGAVPGYMGEAAEKATVAKKDTGSKAAQMVAGVGAVTLLLFSGILLFEGSDCAKQEQHALTRRAPTVTVAMCQRDMTSNADADVTTTASAVQTMGLSKLIDDRPILNRIDLDIPQGSYLAVLGANGAGKSTLLHTLATLTGFTSGQLHLFGQRVGRYSGATLRARIGMIGHQAMLYRELTAHENLMFFSRLYRVPEPARRTDEMLERVGLADRASDQVKAFSRGMVQRLSIARALLHDPDLLLADEPFAGLDVPSTLRVEQLLAQMHAERKTVLLTNHDIDQSLRLADRVVVLRRGVLVTDQATARTSTSDVLQELNAT